jgi:hypothetical protein
MIVVIVMMVTMPAVVVNPRAVVVRAAHCCPFCGHRCTFAAVQQQSFPRPSWGSPWILGI